MTESFVFAGSPPMSSPPMSVESAAGLAAGVATTAAGSTAAASVVSTATMAAENVAVGSVVVTAMLTVQDVAKLLNCSTRSVYRLSDSGRMPRPVKLGALVRWPKAVVENWIGLGCPRAKNKEMSR